MSGAQSREIDAPARGAREGPPQILSSFRLKATLMGFVTVLVVSLSGMVIVLVTRIFDDATATVREDLAWKARRGAAELAQAAELGMILRDEGMITGALGEYRTNKDVLA